MKKKRNLKASRNSHKRGITKLFKKRYNLKIPICNKKWVKFLSELTDRYLKLSDLTMVSQLPEIKVSFYEASIEAQQ